LSFDFRPLIAVEREIQRALKAKKRVGFFPYIGGKYNLLKAFSDRWKTVHRFWMDQTGISE